MKKKELTPKKIQEYLSAEFSKSENNRKKAGKKMYDLVKGIVEDIPIHSVTWRSKDLESFKGKINKPDKHYNKLSDITDLIGIRVTTYFEDDVDKVAKIIEEEFEIDRENSVDKRQLLDPDRFGYMSLHYVASVNKGRCEDRLFKCCKGFSAEIQIRSILQHTWAEIEHDIGYKSEVSVPKNIRRSFSQLASLLEVADCQFVNIRDSLLRYEEELPKHIKTTPQDVLIDKVSIKVLIREKKKILELDKYVVGVTGSSLVDRPEFIESLVERFKFWKYRNIEEVINLLSSYKDKFNPFVEQWIVEKDRPFFDSGISLMYLLYLEIGRNSEIEEIENFASKFSLGDDAEEFAFRLKKITNSIDGN